MKKYLWATGIAAFLIFLILLGYTLQNPRVFPIQTITVIGVSAANQASVAHRIQEVSLGNLWLSNTEDLADRLEAMPWAREVTIRKIWPDQLMITIHPQKFIAIWNGHQALNEDGQLLALPQNLQTIPLSLYGPDEEALMVLAYAQAFQAMLSPLSLTVVWVRLEETGAWSLGLDNGMKIQLGDRQALTRLAAFVKVYGTIFQHSKKKALTVDLRYPQGMAVEWAK